MLTVAELNKYVLLDTPNIAFRMVCRRPVMQPTMVVLKLAVIDVKSGEKIAYSQPCVFDIFTLTASGVEMGGKIYPLNYTVIERKVVDLSVAFIDKQISLSKKGRLVNKRYND